MVTEETFRPLHVFDSRFRELTDLVYVAKSGILFLRVFAGEDDQGGLLSAAGRALRRAGYKSLSLLDREVADRLEELLRAGDRERDSEYSNFHEQACIAAWHAVETAIEDFAINWLRDFDGASRAPALHAIPVPFGDFMSMSAQERAEFLFEKLKSISRSRKGGEAAKPGIEEFQRLLHAIGLAVPVDQTISGPAAELATIRNVVVHRGGIVDQRFIQLCPDLGYAVGDRVRVTAPAFARYMEACRCYVTAVEQSANTKVASEGPSPDPGASAPAPPASPERTDM